jgi:hypothetical protein
MFLLIFGRGQLYLLLFSHYLKECITSKNHFGKINPVDAY